MHKVENMVLKMLDSRKHKSLNKYVEKRNKCGTRPQEVNGITFASKKEAKKYSDLMLEMYAGYIENLEVHPAYDITINGQHVCYVILNFTYYDKRIGKKRYVDTKGFATEVSKLKKKLLEAQYSITVEWI